MKKTPMIPSYWAKKGKHVKLLRKLCKRIPSVGEVPDGSPALERLRRAQNCYYDLYNNGLCNRAEEFQEVFGFLPDQYEEENGMCHPGVPVIAKLERALDHIILKAAKEQSLMPKKMI